MYIVLSQRARRVTDRSLAVNIVKVLGEGGFSFVYLAQDEHSGVSIMPRT